MSQEIIYTCDRCGKHVRVDRSGWVILKSWIQEYDLCLVCKESFQAFMKKRPYKD